MTIRTARNKMVPMRSAFLAHSMIGMTLLLVPMSTRAQRVGFDAADITRLQALYAASDPRLAADILSVAEAMPATYTWTFFSVCGGDTYHLSSAIPPHGDSATCWTQMFSPDLRAPVGTMRLSARINLLTTAWLATGDVAYFNKVKTDVLAVSLWSSWAPSNIGACSPSGESVGGHTCLPQTHLMMAVSFFFDQTRSASNASSLWTAGERSQIATALLNLGVRPTYAGISNSLASATIDRTLNNIMAAGSGALGLGALALEGESGISASDVQTWIDMATTGMNHFLSICGNDGGAWEGISYGDVAMEPLLRFADAAAHTGRDSLLARTEFAALVAFAEATLAPDGSGSVDYSDSPLSSTLVSSVEYLATFPDPTGSRARSYLARAHDYRPWSGLSPVFLSSQPYTLLDPARVGGFPDTGIATARGDPTTNALFASLRVGGRQVVRNTVHAHYDQNSLTLFDGGTWFLTHPGYGGNRTTGAQCSLLVVTASGLVEQTEFIGGQMGRTISVGPIAMLEGFAENVYPAGTLSEFRRRVFVARGRYALVDDRVAAPSAGVFEMRFGGLYATATSLGATSGKLDVGTRTLTLQALSNASPITVTAIDTPNGPVRNTHLAVRHTSTVALRSIVFLTPSRANPSAPTVSGTTDVPCFVADGVADCWQTSPTATGPTPWGTLVSDADTTMISIDSQQHVAAAFVLQGQSTSADAGSAALLQLNAAAPTDFGLERVSGEMRVSVARDNGGAVQGAPLVVHVATACPATPVVDGITGTGACIDSVLVFCIDDAGIATTCPQNDDGAPAGGCACASLRGMPSGDGLVLLVGVLLLLRSRRRRLPVQRPAIPLFVNASSGLSSCSSGPRHHTPSTPTHTMMELRPPSK